MRYDAKACIGCLRLGGRRSRAWERRSSGANFTCFALLLLRHSRSVFSRPVLSGNQFHEKGFVSKEIRTRRK